MGTIVIMRVFLLFTLASAVFAENLNQVQRSKDNTLDATEDNFNCPMLDIDLNGNDQLHFSSIDSWRECADICNVLGESYCKFWTFNPVDPENLGCWLKYSASGMSPIEGFVSGERGCTG